MIEVGEDQQAALAAAREIRERVEQLDEHVEWALDRIPAEAMRYGILHREDEELEVLAAAEHCSSPRRPRRRPGAAPR